MNELLSQPSPEQLMLGGLLAIIIDKDLDFDPGYFEDDEMIDMIGGVMGSLYEQGEDAEQVLKSYGVIEAEEETKNEI